MKKINKDIIIGVDHGYGYMKTAGTIMKSGIEEYPVKPPFLEDILEADRRVFVVGQIRNEHTADKTVTKDYYYMTLAAMAKELKLHQITVAKNVILSVGLPYSFYAVQKEELKEYLMQKKNVTFTFEGIKYSVEIKDVMVYPQGLPVLAKELDAYRDKTISVADIGSRTIDVITYRQGKPYYDRCFSIDKKGTLDCVENIAKYYLGKYQEAVDEEDIQRLFQKKNVNLSAQKIQFVKNLIKFYAKDVMKLLESRLSNPIILCGGGAVVLQHYYDEKKVNLKIINDIHCNARGYEILTYNRIK